MRIVKLNIPKLDNFNTVGSSNEPEDRYEIRRYSAVGDDYILNDGDEDKTLDILTINNHGERLLGYGRSRELMKNAVISIVSTDFSDWGNLSDEEKLISIKWVVAPYALRVSMISDDQDKVNWNKLIVESQGKPVHSYRGRALVVELMREAVGDELRRELISKDDIDDFYESTQQLLDSYVASNSPSFKDWLCGEFDGFSQKSYFSIERRDYLMNIYNGNY